MDSVNTTSEKERNTSTSNKNSANPTKKSDKIRTAKTVIKKPKIGRTVQAIASRYSRSVKHTAIKKPKPIKKEVIPKISAAKITPYAFFVKSFFKEYRRRNPEEKLDFIALSRQCAKQWHELSDEMREEFHKMAKRANSRLSRVHKIIDDVKPKKVVTSPKHSIRASPSTSRPKTVRMAEPKRESKVTDKIARDRDSIRATKRSMDKGTITMKTKTNTKKINTLKCRESGKSVKELTTKKKPKRSDP